MSCCWNVSELFFLVHDVPTSRKLFVMWEVWLVVGRGAEELVVLCGPGSELRLGSEKERKSAKIKIIIVGTGKKKNS